MLKLKPSYSIRLTVLALALAPACSWGASTGLNLASLLNKNAGRMNPSQQTVKEALERFADGYETCEQALGGRKKILSNEAIMQTAPGWLIEAAERAFSNNEEFSGETLSLVANHKFLTDVKVTGDADEVTRTAVHKALLEASPVSSRDLGSKITAEILNIGSSNNTVSFKLNLSFDNGQSLSLQFRNADIGVKSKSEAIGQLVITSIFSRVILTSDANLRQEMNALRYDLMKAMRLAEPGMQQKLAALVSELEDNQPKRGMFSGWLSGSTMFKGTDTILGRSFLSYLRAKEILISMAQDMQSKAAQTAGTKREKRDSAVQYVPRVSRAMTAGKSAQGFYAPRQAQRVVTRDDRRRDDTSGFETFLWIYDPFYMFSHPWYWGARDGTFMHYWMMYDWITHNNQRHDEQRSVFQPSQPYDMNRFDQPVDPVYTSRADQPFVDPWSRTEVPAQDQIVPQVDRHGGVAWTDQTGNRSEVAEQTSGPVSARWNQASGQSDPEPAAAAPAEINPSERESASFKAGSDGAGWGQPSVQSHPERDTSISGYK